MTSGLPAQTIDTAEQCSYARLCMVTILLFGLAGCATTALPDLGVEMPDRWQQLPSNARPPATRSDPQDWWRAFADPQLDALVAEAMNANLDIAQAGARLQAARALHETASAPLRPNLHFRTSDPIDPDASASFLVAGFDSVWELDLFGRGTALHRIARGDLDSATAQLHDAQVSIGAEVARMWVEMHSAQRRQVLLSRIRDARQAQLSQNRTRLRLGLESPMDLAKARAALAQSEATLTQPRAEEISAAQGLAVLLGRSEPDPAWRQPAATPQLGEWRMTSAPANLLRTRPDIARSEAEVLRAAGELGIAKADQYPSIAIGGSIVWSTSEAEKRPTSTNRIGSFGPIIDIPLFDWGMRRAQAQAKDSQLQAAVLAYRKTVLTAVAEVESALGAVEQDRLREQAHETAWKALSEAAAHTQQRLQIGLASSADNLGSQVERDQAELDLLDARSARAFDYIALCKAMGGAVQTPATPLSGLR